MKLVMTIQTISLKSGRIQAADDTWTPVVFTEPFKLIPNVILTLEDKITAIENLSVRNITINGFEVQQECKSAATEWIQWIATDQGN